MNSKTQRVAEKVYNENERRDSEEKGGKKSKFVNFHCVDIKLKSAQ